MKKINIQTFVMVSIGFGILLVPAFIGAAAIDEGTAGNSVLCTIFSKLFLVLRFPTHILFWPIVSENGLLYLLGLLLNCLLYGLIVERTISIFKSRRTIQIE